MRLLSKLWQRLLVRTYRHLITINWYYTVHVQFTYIKDKVCWSNIDNPQRYEDISCPNAVSNWSKVRRLGHKNNLLLSLFNGVIKIVLRLRASHNILAPVTISDNKYLAVNMPSCRLEPADWEIALINVHRSMSILKFDRVKPCWFIPLLRKCVWNTGWRTNLPSVWQIHWYKRNYVLALPNWLNGMCHRWGQIGKKYSKFNILK